jgi:hypothetical protein
MGPPSLKNAGSGPAHACGQRAINDCGGHVFDSGLLTPVDVDGINEYGEAWVKAMCRQMAARYQEIVAKNPTKAGFLATWLRRSAWPYKTIP